MHEVKLSPHKITVDGVELIISTDNPAPSIEPIDDTGFSIVTVGIICRQVTLDGDDHDHPESTPIYDELNQEEPMTADKAPTRSIINRPITITQEDE